MARLWVARLAGGEVDGKALEALRAWRLSNPDNNAAFEEERRLYRSLGPLEPAFAAGAPLEKPATSGRAWMASMSAALLAFSLAWLAFDPLVLMRADHRAGSGEIVRVALPDGSSALLNSESAIDIAYDGRERRVRILSGEAWFDVKRDRDHPFVVEADGATARALGTAYSVARLEGGGVALAVTHGTVAFAGPGRPKGIEVAAGTSARMDAGGNPIRLSRRAGDMVAWRSGRIVIENRSLAEVAGELSRYRRGRIMVLGSASSRRVSGVLKLDEIDRGLEGLAASQGLKLTHVTPWLVILR
jgi:transmembrane sensor